MLPSKAWEYFTPGELVNLYFIGKKVALATSLREACIVGGKAAKNIVLYGWLRFTSKVHSPDELIIALVLSHVPWTEIKGARGCKDRKYLFDVAFDDHAGLLDVRQIVNDAQCGMYASKSDYWEVALSSKGSTVQVLCRENLLTFWSTLERNTFLPRGLIAPPVLSRCIVIPILPLSGNPPFSS